MKHFNLLMNACNGLLINLENINHMLVAPIILDVDFEVTTKKLKLYAVGFNERPFYSTDDDIHFYIFNAKEELSEYLIDKNKRDLVIQKVESKLSEFNIRLSAVIKKWNLNHVDHAASFYDDFFMKIQPIHDFTDWFRLETGLYTMVGREMVVDTKNANPFREADQFLRKLVVVGLVKHLSERNIEFIHKRNFAKYVFRTSDTVKVNGIEYDELDRQFQRLKLANKPIESLEIDGKFAGFSIQESDFITEALQWLDSEPKLNAKDKKKAYEYKKYLLNRLEVLSESEEHPERLDYPVNIFLKFENYQLFEYFVEHFGYSKRVVDLSQIYRWLEDNGKIKTRSGIEYRAFVVAKELVNGNFAKTASKKHDSQTTLNELYKKFSTKS